MKASSGLFRDVDSLKKFIRLFMLAEAMQDKISQQHVDQKEILGFRCPEHGVVLIPAVGKHMGTYLSCPKGGWPHFNVRSTPPYSASGELAQRLGISLMEPEIVDNPKFSAQGAQRQAKNLKKRLEDERVHSKMVAAVRKFMASPSGSSEPLLIKQFLIKAFPKHKPLSLDEIQDIASQGSAQDFRMT